MASNPDTKPEGNLPHPDVRPVSRPPHPHLSEDMRRVLSDFSERASPRGGFGIFSPLPQEQAASTSGRPGYGEIPNSLLVDAWLIKSMYPTAASGFISPAETEMLRFFSRPSLPLEANPLHALFQSRFRFDMDKALELLKQGVSLEERNSKGETPLCSAARAGEQGMALLLLAYGARVAVTTDSGYSPKAFREFYTCDHELDVDGCIPSKKLADAPMRQLLETLEMLEENHMHKESGTFSLDSIKDSLLNIIRDPGNANPRPVAALCGYVYHHVVEEEREAVVTFFRENAGMDISAVPFFSEAFQTDSASRTARPAASCGQ